MPTVVQLGGAPNFPDLRPRSLAKFLRFGARESGSLPFRTFPTSNVHAPSGNQSWQATLRTFPTRHSDMNLKNNKVLVQLSTELSRRILSIPVLTLPFYCP